MPREHNEPESNFGSTVVAIGFEDAVTIVQREVPSSQLLDPKVVGDIIAASLAIGGYVGAELSIANIDPPSNERASFRSNFKDARARLDAVVEHTLEQVVDRLAAEPETPIQ